MARARDDMQLNGLLDRGCSFEGKLTFDGTVQINGDFKGEIFSDGTLIVGNEAHVNANVQVDTLIVDGSVEGIIEAKQKIELHKGSRILANISTPSLVIEEGSLFHGQCQMITDNSDVRDERPRTAVQSTLATEEGEDSLMM